MKKKLRHCTNSVVGHNDTVAIPPITDSAVDDRWHVTRRRYHIPSVLCRLDTWFSLRISVSASGSSLIGKLGATPSDLPPDHYSTVLVRGLASRLSIEPIPDLCTIISAGPADLRLDPPPPVPKEVVLCSHDLKGIRGREESQHILPSQQAILSPRAFSLLPKTYYQGYCLATNGKNRMNRSALWEMPSSFLTGFLECRHRPSCGTDWTHILAGGAAGRSRFESTDRWRMLILEPHNSECDIHGPLTNLATCLETGASDNSSGLTDPPSLVDGRYFQD